MAQMKQSRSGKQALEAAEEARQLLVVPSKVSRLMRRRVQPSNCSALRWCRFWLAGMRTTVLEFRPAPAQTMCLRWNTRPAYIGETSCESFWAANKTKSLPLLNTGWISVCLRDPRQVMGIRKCHPHYLKVASSRRRICVDWTVPFKGEENKSLK